MVQVGRTIVIGQCERIYQSIEQVQSVEIQPIIVSYFVVFGLSQGTDKHKGHQRVGLEECEENGE